MNKKRILIIDDDVTLSQSVKLNLEDTGHYEVLVENRSAHAITAAHSFRPDLMLLDYVMPGMDGGDISKSFREDPSLSRVPVIMITALLSNSETGEAGAILRGGRIMVAKPVKLEKLLRCIEDTLRAAAA